MDNISTIFMDKFFTIFVIAVGVCHASLILLVCVRVLCLFVANPGELLFRAFERKKSGEKPLPAERRSRSRVTAIMSDPSLPAKEKCLALFAEIARVDHSILVSREWKQALSSEADRIIAENGLSFEELL